MKIIIDTREQLPLDFEHPYITEIVRKKCEVGDYGCEYNDGHQAPIYFERKSIGDLFGTLSTGYKRFKKEIQRAKKNNTLLIIIIEGNLGKILKGCENSQRCGDEVCQQLFTLLIRYRLPFVCCENREMMSRWITEFYLAYGREYIANKKVK